ncbi:MAG: LuxR C-terminal-related transcriptional regulator [Cellvibrionales bacterium]|nr:LuxR C-terminal-related transcriptional regulator [Cellvibrionales bacterium]
MFNRPLTKLETWTLKLRSEGNSAKMIAKIQGVSPNTIAGRENSIRYKLGVKNMYEAIRKGFEQGILAIAFGLMFQMSLGVDAQVRTPKARPSRVRTSRAKNGKNKQKNNILELPVNLEDLVYVIA